MVQQGKQGNTPPLRPCFQFLLLFLSLLICSNKYIFQSSIGQGNGSSASSSLQLLVGGLLTVSIVVTVLVVRKYQWLVASTQKCIRKRWPFRHFLSGSSSSSMISNDADNNSSDSISSERHIRSSETVGYKWEV